MADDVTITVFLADDNLIVREGVRALIERHEDLQVVGVAADYDEVVQGAAQSLEPQVLVTDIRMPPSFNREGIDAAKEVRKRHPGTGSSSCRSTTTPSTPSRCWPRAPPATATC
jgi:adenylate cyclase